MTTELKLRVAIRKPCGNMIKLQRENNWKNLATKNLMVYCITKEDFSQIGKAQGNSFASNEHKNKLSSQIRML